MPGTLDRCDELVRRPELTAFLAVTSDLTAATALAPSLPNRLFVYGTLAPGESNAHVLRGLPGRWSAASVRGRVIAVVDSGPACGYPGIVLDEAAGLVRGLLFSSERLPAHWARIDRFEGEGYERVLTRAALAGGAVVDAWVYRLRLTPPIPGQP